MSKAEISADKPLFSISTAAQLLKISVHTMRLYEREGLIIPFKKNSGQRLYSKEDIERLECIRRAINESKLGISGIKIMYSLIPCWDIVKCSEEDRRNCNSFVEHSKPCWSYAHENNTCQERNCRECDVYKKHSQCSAIKDLIKTATNR